MGKNASGMYVIDADYNIVSYNHAAEIIYPELKKEKNVIDVFSIMRNHVKAVLLSTGLKVRRIIWNRGGMFCGPLMR